MRTDIKHVVVERPRFGPRGRVRKYTTHKDIEDAPSKESVRCRYKDRKESTDYLKPLAGFLIKSVGRPWDNVYSFIRDRLNGNSTMQAHVLQHVWGYVLRSVHDVDGVLYDNQGFEIRSTKNFPRFFVDPKGILQEVPRATGRRKRKLTYSPLVVFPEVPRTQFRVLNTPNGPAWFKLVLAVTTKDCFDVFTGAHYVLSSRDNWSLGYEREQLYGSSGLYCSKIVPCGKRELKRIARITLR